VGQLETRRDSRKEGAYLLAQISTHIGREAEEDADSKSQH